MSAITQGIAVDRLPFFQRMALVGTNATEYMRSRKQPKLAHGLPPDIRFDGPQNVGSKTLMQFTDTVTGDTFTLLPSSADYVNITAAAAQRRAVRNQHKMMAASFGPVASL